MKRLAIISATLALAGCASSREATSTRFFELGGRVEPSRHSLVVVTPGGRTAWIVSDHSHGRSRRWRDRHGEKK